MSINRHGIQGARTGRRVGRGLLAACLSVGAAATLTAALGGTAGAAAHKVSPLAPSITKVSPNFGPGSGGTIVTIDGTHLRLLKSVKFDTVRAKVTKVVSDDEIRVKSPKGSGTVDIVATNTHGKSAVSSNDEFNYQTTSG